MRTKGFYRVTFRRRGKYWGENDRIVLHVEAATFPKAAKEARRELNGFLAEHWRRSWVLEGVAQTVI